MQRKHLTTLPNFLFPPFRPRKLGIENLICDRKIQTLFFLPPSALLLSTFLTSELENRKHNKWRNPLSTFRLSLRNSKIRKTTKDLNLLCTSNFRFPTSDFVNQKTHFLPCLQLPFLPSAGRSQGAETQQLFPVQLSLFPFPPCTSLERIPRGGNTNSVTS